MFLLEESMLKTLSFFFLIIFAVASLYAAGPIIEQRPDGGSIESRPEGGFSNKISGEWKCEQLGTMTLKQSGNKVKGTYTHQEGTIEGEMTKYTFRGKWQQKKDNKKGSFLLAASIERKVPRPTHLRGQWKYDGDKEWQTKKWSCVRK